MFTTLVSQPIFNILVAIYALIPGHNFGLALIIFTVLSRLAMWPLVKKQLYQAKAMRALQPQLKAIKLKNKGDKKAEQAMMMELYKEVGINPFGQIGILIVQLPLFIALYSGISRVVKHNDQIVSFSYGFIRDLPWMHQLAGNLGRFDNTLFGVVDLKRAAQSSSGWYFPALAIVVASAILQYFVSKQLTPTGDGRGLRDILKGAKGGQMAEQADVSAAVNRNMLLLTPLLIGFITLRIPAALALYLLVGSIVAFFQQRYILGKDEVKLEAIADGKPVEATIVSSPKSTASKPLNKKNKKRKK